MKAKMSFFKSGHVLILEPDSVELKVSPTPSHIIVVFLNLQLKMLEKLTFDYINIHLTPEKQYLRYVFIFKSHLFVLTLNFTAASLQGALMQFWLQLPRDAAMSSYYCHL